MKTFLSIIIPTLNEEKYLPQLLTNLTEQSFKDFEVIVADGQSTDKTIATAKTYTGKIPKLTLLTSSKKNVCHQRNLGASQATADWLVFVDADVHLEPYFFQGIKYRLEQTNPGILATYAEFDSTDPKDRIAATLVNWYIDVLKTTATPIVMESFMVVKKSVFEKLGGFNPSIHMGEGADLLKRALKLNLHLTLSKDPIYQFSLRRLRSQGTLKLIRGIAVSEINRILLKKNLSSKTAAKLYPMQGGKAYSEVTPPSPIEEVTDLLDDLKQLFKTGNQKTKHPLDNIKKLFTILKNQTNQKTIKN